MADREAQAQIMADFHGLCRGDFSKAASIRDALEPIDGAVSETWECALRAAEWLAGLRTDLPSFPAATLGEPWIDSQLEASTRAGEFLWHAHMLMMDASAATATLELAGFGSDPLEKPAAIRLGRAALAHLIGRTEESIAEELTDVGGKAAETENAAVVIEAMAFRALHALDGDRLEEAIKLARRASRMGRTEAIPQSEYLANAVLARVRRMSGRPHLAMRILAGLSKVVPPAWHGWVGWELVMAGGLDAAHLPIELGRLEEDAAPRHLISVLERAAAGDAPGFDDALRDLDCRVEGWLPQRRDASLLRAALDPRGESEGSHSAIKEFRRGRSNEIPLGLAGLAGETPETLAYVCVGPSTPARRVLAPGAALFAGPLALMPPEESGRPGRTEKALAVLAFAGPEGLTEAELFKDAYGFEYSRELHRGVLGVVIHRARARIGESAVLHRDERRVRLEPKQPMVFADPRCAHPVEDQVLQFVARKGRSSAKDASKALGISLRSAQAALQALVSDGACDRERDGRKVRYVVEDTTFQEPTRHKTALTLN